MKCGRERERESAELKGQQNKKMRNIREVAIQRLNFSTYS